MEEGILDIQLMYCPRFGECKRENCTDGGRLDHWTEGFVAVDTDLLRLDVDYKARLVALKGTIRPELMTK